MSENGRRVRGVVLRIETRSRDERRMIHRRPSDWVPLSRLRVLQRVTVAGLLFAALVVAALRVQDDDHNDYHKEGQTGGRDAGDHAVLPGRPSPRLGRRRLCLLIPERGSIICDHL